MKALVGAALALFALTVPSAADVPCPFRGTVRVTAVQNCPFTPVDEIFEANYHLANLCGNANYTSLSLYADRRVDNYQLASGRFTNAFKQVAGVSLEEARFEYIGRVRITKSVPTNANIKANTKILKVTGQIERFQNQGFGANLCLVTFNGAFVKVPAIVD